MVKVFRSRIPRKRRSRVAALSVVESDRAAATEEAQDVDRGDSKGDVAEKTVTENAEAIPVSQESQHEEAPTELAIRNPEQNQITMSRSLHLWLRSADALLKSSEMKNLLRSTRVLANATGDAVVHAVTLPVRLPLSLLTSTPSGCDTSERRGLFFHVVDFVPSVFRTIDELGSKAAELLVSSRSIETDTKYGMISGESTQEREAFLERFQIGGEMEEAQNIGDCNGFARRPTKSDYSKHLLRVDDLSLTMSDGNPDGISKPSMLSYVDLGREFGNDDLTSLSLQKLMCYARDLMRSNADQAPYAMPKGTTSVSDVGIRWEQEGNTASDMVQIANMSERDQCRFLHSSRVLVWSGQCRRSDEPFFMARGIILMSPRGVLDMLWDSNRTEEYNNFSMGRSDTLILEDEVSSGRATGSKIVTSVTKVPFTSFTVQLSVLMYAMPINEDDVSQGYIIVSRSVGIGAAGCHTGQRVDRGTNEILMGVNVMRPVPGEPGQTDFYSASQVRSAAVPRFLSKKIGLMGVKDFFTKTNATVREMMNNEVE